MPVTFNHTIVATRDRHESARFFRDLFELPEAPSWGPSGHAIELITRPYL